ncbi:MAG: hypothetical protein COA84_13330 [Robiginitomaculum sp.]|nr:MAG: hypothetical protein COA84_13330 [Robiginitomaculum sp.]
MPLSDAEKALRLGALGENLYANIKNNAGCNVQLSLDPYDFTRDMLVDDKTIEIKTQMLMHSIGRFTINKNQAKKCAGVDILVMIETPHIESGDVVRIYEFMAGRDSFSLNTTYIGGLHKYTIDPSRGKLICEIQDPYILNLMKKYSTSAYKRFS